MVFRTDRKGKEYEKRNEKKFGICINSGNADQCCEYDSICRGEHGYFSNRISYPRGNERPEQRLR